MKVLIKDCASGFGPCCVTFIRGPLCDCKNLHIAISQHKLSLPQQENMITFVNCTAFIKTIQQCCSNIVPYFWKTMSAASSISLSTKVPPVGSRSVFICLTS